MVKTGQADIILDINKTQERQQYLTYLPHYREQPLPLKFYTRKSANITINNYQDLLPLTIGVIRGYTYFKAFDKDDNLLKVPLNTKVQLINMLRYKRIEAFIARGDTLSVLPEFQQYQDEFTISTLQYSKAVPSYLGLSKRSAFHNQQAFIEQNLRELVKSGEIEKIFQ